MAGYNSAGVAVGVAEIGRRKPAGGALPSDDARESVTFRVSELAPWRIRIDFLCYYLEDDPPPADRYQYVPVGFELTLPVSISAANAEPDAAEEIFPPIAARFAKHYEVYCLHGELLLRHRHGQLSEIRAALVSGKAHKYHPLLVASYRARAGTPTRIYDMAEEFNVSRSTIWRELRVAVEQGLINEDELDRRPTA